MIISTRTRYGFRLLIYLAQSNRDSNIQLSEIANKEGISMKYLEKIVQILKRAGFVRVTRGAKGGYRLSRDSSKINLRDVFASLEGSVSVTDTEEKCSGFTLWEGLSDVISDYFESQTLKDISDKQNDYTMYYI